MENFEGMSGKDIGRWMRWHHEKINPHIQMDGKFVGQFEYSFNDIKDSDITLDDVGVLAFGNFIFYEPQREKWFSVLIEKTAENPDQSMKEIINEIQKMFGRGSIREPKKSFSKYWIITPAGIGKTRHAKLGPLKESQVNSLLKRGFTVLDNDQLTFEQIQSRFYGTIELIQ